MSSASSPETFPFRDPELPDEARIDDLLARLTLAEKVAALSTDPSVPRLGLLGSRHVEGLHGLALGGPANWGKDEPTPTTTFPQAIGLAATWDPELVRQAAAAEAREARFVFHRSGGKHGGIVVRAPNADLGRDPRWGRTEECYGEDAFLTSALTVAFVRGLQGDHPRYWQTAALLKHFLANSNEDGRERSSSNFDETLLHDYYALPFQRGIEAGGARAYMAAYNAYNGVPCAVHPILRALTVEKWGQNGIICTDGGAFQMLVKEHGHYPDLPTAAAATIEAGITQFLDDYKGSLEQALERGLVTERELERALRGNFRVMLRLGLWDPKELVPYAQVDLAREPWLGEEHRALCREVTRKSIVLLKNERGTLPLERPALRTVAVVGRLAERVLLDWYSGTPPYAVSPLAGICAALGPGVQVTYCDGSVPEDAERLARRADVVIACAGNHPTGDGPWAKVTLPSYGKEAVDRQALELEDEALLRRLHAVNPRTVLVLLASFPYAIEWSQGNLPAIVQLTHNSQELGNALADVLFGDYNPAGRAVQTWPRALGDLPPMMDYDIRNGRTYQHFAGTPLYPFGHGLSYTSFAYGRLETSANALDIEGTLELAVDVTNTGARGGDEVVQVYGARPDRAPGEPLQQLVAFARLGLEPGQTQRLRLSVHGADLAAYSPAAGRRRLRAGPLELRLGGSSADIRQTSRVELVASEEPTS
jgi:beta-glucosidase